jgi:hypothetical protein
MPLALRNTIGIWGIPFLLVLNVSVTVAVVLLQYIEPVLAVGLMWFWAYFHLLQTRVMAVILFVGWVCVPIIGAYSAQVSIQTGIYALGFLTVATIVAHLVAAVITAIIGI